ncbi:nucleotide-binding protein [Porphyromonas sp. oral taxon 278]|uniref:nucleotide-binding protein n=1 Tax=Porphyromonas sp. oral taxon 278 TaxID=712437 RepID=UPI0025E617DD|nr:nucleotide-binding protein [Porphyromonas sp. oral taxon 278]
MPYYHVYIESDDPRAQCFELDKTDLSELKEDVILPYLKGDQFHFDGYLLRGTKVERILIMKSDISYEEYVKLRKQRSRYPVSRSDILARSEYFNNITGEILKECKSQLQEATTKPEVTTPNITKAPMDKSKVFIVHGHDDGAKEAVARFVENLGFEAIILHEQANSGKTIIEKIEEYTDVGFGIVLYTPCDEGRPKGKDQLEPRARQNVVFEHGYLIGKIGRENVCALVKGDIEKPTDISGVVYIEMDKGSGWKLAVADEMEACGYEVDRSKIKR